MSLRLKMTFLFCGILALTMLLFGFNVYYFMDYNLNAEADRAIVEIAEDFVRSTKILGDFPLPLRQVELPEIDVFANPNTYIQVVDQNGAVVAQSDNLGGQVMPLGETTLGDIDYGQGFHETVLIGTQRLSVYNRPLVIEGEVVGVLQVGRTMGPIEAALNRLRLLLLIGGGLALYFTGTLGWFLAGATLRPISRITETAQAIQQARDLNRRIDYNGPRDEVGHLAETLNQMLERLYKAYQDLKEAEAAQRRFVSDASHELRTPITTIRGNAELLRKMGDSHPAARAEALSDIICETERMTRLVTNLLALARADAGYQMEMTPIALVDLLSETFRQAAVLAVDVNFTVKDTSSLKGVLVRGNADYLKQLFLILLQNAFQYAGAGEKVWVESRKLAGWSEVLVYDSGAGIDEQDLPLVFDRFYRAGRTRHSDGTGLGLAIAKWIVEQHEGTISVKNSIGKGCVFSVRLPGLK
ncbi:MAG: putative sensor histidine kinase TcrY [Pelotomaculum sp. PtaB.Bin104]|nr:MAG: putative sensor histidine kinase TcrY [Pelotomaculum sp. PtaB.Bin104]